MRPIDRLLERGHTTRALAEEAGLSYGTVRDMVSGHARLSGTVREAVKRLIPLPEAEEMFAEADRLWAANDRRRASRSKATRDAKERARRG